MSEHSIDDDSPPVLLRACGLDIDRPDGAPLLRGADLELRAGEIVALLGGSGAGKSTLVTALHDRASLEAAGFLVDAQALERHAGVGIVPQRGALFDHLDVAGNLALAMRNAYPPRRVDAGGLQDALESVDLPRAWAGGEPRGVGHLSGGEAQRLAVARTLAGGRRILFLDEPSVGLDPLRVEGLADLLRAEIRRRGAAALVITHELEFAAGFADRFMFMDRREQALVELEPLPGDASPEERAALRSDSRPRALRRRVAASIGDQMTARLAADEAPSAEPRPSALARSASALAGAARRGLQTIFGGLQVGPRVLANLGRALARPRDLFEVLGPVIKQALLRPAAFFGVVSLLIGFTLLYILHRAVAGGELPLLPERVFSLIGSMHVIALAPALSGILFAATSANAVVAWLGGMSLTRQTTALRALGIEAPRYLWVPAFIGLVGAYLVLAALFALGMLAGGAAYLELRVPELGGWGPAWELLTADLVDPPPQRAIFRERAAGLTLLYALGIAGDAVAKGSQDKRSAEAVTIAMVRSVMTTTSWIVALELLSLLLIYRAG
ncbi:ATP-binding cassette domain-containing protein [Pseudenhygromyxa sp. WMMC2535]|uniref:ATP-binding cassette domain-containing protein n=1 Tax=Pseudenhygromyxa sp. WMMC2535 TaxID=2712867 RepID=UPI0015520C3D|nr:ATP-binding cassette domain-containing protein [Pseudenhygromyxa sp. WMMC2535]NVB38096.1 ATP-binding cassette domain-containing protein [Pseudenhygromyxa sp. WMMC2535]